MSHKFHVLIRFFFFMPLLALSFQNCGQKSAPVTFSSPSESLSSETEGTGGQPYDGKVYVILGPICPDNSKIQTKIVLKNLSEGSLIRDNCQDQAPVALSSNDFQLDPGTTEKIYFRSQQMSAENKINIAAINTVEGYGYWLRQDFGTPGDTNETPTRSVLRVFENGIELGPAHSQSLDIRNFGQGRFSHWDSTATLPGLHLSTSDNTDPRTNGRRYTYVVGP